MSTAAPSSPTPRPKPRTSGVVIPHQPKWYMRVAAWIIVAVIRAVAWTLRYRLNDRSEYLNRAPAGPAICCVWHNRLVLCIPIYRSHVSQRNANAGIAAMVSASKDGGFLTGILECLKVEPVRGSSSRRGPQALLEMITWAERGYDVALTPDGPRGPRYVVQEGVMALAQLTGCPSSPVLTTWIGSCNCKAGTGFRSRCLFPAAKSISARSSACPGRPRTGNARPCARNSKPACAGCPATDP